MHPGIKNGFRMSIILCHAHFAFQIYQQPKEWEEWYPPTFSQVLDCNKWWRWKQGTINHSDFRDQGCMSFANLPTSLENMRAVLLHFIERGWHVVKTGFSLHWQGKYQIFLQAVSKIDTVWVRKRQNQLPLSATIPLTVSDATGAVSE